MITGLGDYVSSLPAISFRLYPHQDLREWMGSWTLTYFIWWIAWAPFVGIFIARISKGRTIREFVAGVLLAPTAFSLIWFSVFGGMGIYEETQGEGGIASVVKEDVDHGAVRAARPPAGSGVANGNRPAAAVHLHRDERRQRHVRPRHADQPRGDGPASSSQARLGDHAGGPGRGADFTRNIEVVRAGAISFALPLTLILLLQAAALVRALGSDAAMSGSETEPRSERAGAPIPSETTEAGDSRQPGLEGA